MENWEPLKIQEGLSFKRRLNSFSKLLVKYSKFVKLTKHKIPIAKNSCFKYNFCNYFVYVHKEVHTQFLQEFKPFIKGKQITYDNLINICIMVKNAGDGFKEVLTRNLPYMDRYTILDTGSTDNTVSIAREVLKDKTGNIYEEPFIDFPTSRNRLLDLAGEHCHFNIMLDDTYILNGDIRYFLDIVRGDDVATSYSISIKCLGDSYLSNRILKSSLKLRYEGKIHEIIQKKNNEVNVSFPFKYGYIEDITSEYMNQRTKNRKQSDLKILLEMNKENPSIERTYYYIADTYIFLKEWKKAFEWFVKRSKMLSGNLLEVRESLYYIAVIKDMYLSYDWKEVYHDYINCYNYDPKRPECLYLIGDKYYIDKKYHIAHMYFKQAFELGFPEIDMNYRNNIYSIHLPKKLIETSNYLNDDTIGFKACERLLTSKVKIEPNETKMYKSWHALFYHAMKGKSIREKIKLKSKLICFISPAGWKNWNGKILREKGLGGSEKFVINYAEMLVKFGYNVFVFCKNDEEIEYNGVQYKPTDMIYNFIQKYHIDVCIVNRIPEYIKMCTLNCKKVYYVLHDHEPITNIIYINNLSGIFCISKWHRENFTSTFKKCLPITKEISYVINVDEYKLSEPKNKYSFIYPSFPNRGLLELLQMWDKILNKYPSAKLNLFCDMENKWCKEFWNDKLEGINKYLLKYKNSVTNHGWVNGDVLRQYWKKSHIWFYPCIFHETCCLTAWEAAASKTLVVSNNLAALETSIGNRGVVLNGNPETKEWQDKILTRLFDVLDTEQETYYIEQNYKWVKTKNPYDTIKKFDTEFL